MTRVRREVKEEVGVDVKEGEFIVAVNGKPTSDVDNIYELLLNTPGRLVTLSVNKEPKAEGARASAPLHVALDPAARAGEGTDWKFWFTVLGLAVATAVVAFFLLPRLL